MHHWHIFAFSLGMMGLSVMCLIYSATSSGNGAMTFGLVSGTFCMLGGFGGLVAGALRNIHERLKLIEEKQAATEQVR